MGRFDISRTCFVGSSAHALWEGFHWRACLRGRVLPVLGKGSGVLPSPVVPSFSDGCRLRPHGSQGDAWMRKYVAVGAGEGVTEFAVAWPAVAALHAVVPVCSCAEKEGARCRVSRFIWGMSVVARCPIDYWSVHVVLLRLRPGGPSVFSAPPAVGPPSSLPLHLPPLLPPAVRLPPCIPCPSALLRLLPPRPSASAASSPFCAPPPLSRLRPLRPPLPAFAPSPRPVPRIPTQPANRAWPARRLPHRRLPARSLPHRRLPGLWSCCVLGIDPSASKACKFARTGSSLGYCRGASSSVGVRAPSTAH